VSEGDREVKDDEFHFYAQNAPAMSAIGFESGKERGLKEKLFPFLAR